MLSATEFYQLTLGLQIVLWIEALLYLGIGVYELFDDFFEKPQPWMTISGRVNGYVRLTHCRAQRYPGRVRNSLRTGADIHQFCDIDASDLVKLDAWPARYHHAIDQTGILASVGDVHYVQRISATADSAHLCCTQPLGNICVCALHQRATISAFHVFNVQGALH
jgi:hypothetical protein